MFSCSMALNERQKPGQKITSYGFYFQSLSSAMFIRFTMKTNVDEKEKEGKKKLARFNVKGTVNSSPYALKCIHIG